MSLAETKKFELDKEAETSLRKFQLTLDREITENDIFNQLVALYNASCDRFAPFEIWAAMELTYMSANNLILSDKHEQINGKLDTLILGNSGTGKTHTFRILKKRYNQGATVDGCHMTTTSLLGRIVGDTFEKGIVTKNNKGLVFIDDIHENGQGKKFGAKNLLLSVDEVRRTGLGYLQKDGEEFIFEADARLITTGLANDIDYFRSFDRSPLESQLLRTIALNTTDNLHVIGGYDLITYFDEDKSFSRREHTPVTLDVETSDFEAKVKWAWSLNSVELDKNISKYIRKVAEDELRPELNYDRLYTKRTYEKFAKFVVALCIALVSTDNFEDIIVTEAHVNIAATLYLHLLYQNTL